MSTKIEDLATEADVDRALRRFTTAVEEQLGRRTKRLIVAGVFAVVFGTMLSLRTLS